MVYRPNYGSVKKTTTLKDGTEKSVETTFADGKETSDRITYTKRVKVNDQSQEFAEYLSFRKLTNGKKNVSFVVEQIGAATYAIMTWTEKV